MLPVECFMNIVAWTYRYEVSPSAVFEKVKDKSLRRGYFLTYDGAGRLTEATYGESTSLASNTGRYTEKVTGYDRNGNMTGFRRYGKTSSGGFGLLDDLTYTLEGNRMVAVSDAVSTAALTGNTTFTDGTSSGTEYTYDADGRMTSDLNRGLTAMTYNVMGLLSGVTKSSGASATWNYDGSGRKVRRAVTSSGGTMVTTDYIGNAVYTDGVLALLRIPNGYVTMSGTTPSYHYYQKDHLGSNRMVTTAGGTVQQISHFYPFGGVFGESSGATLQRFKFTDKEQDFSILPGWYDFGARYYDPVLCQWTGPDPLSGKYPAWSPYAYCKNSPAWLVDPDGWEPIKKSAGSVMGFVSFMNSIKTGIGLSTGAMAHEAMLRMGRITIGSKGIQPAFTGPFNASKDRYIYTNRGGWIDMSHFMFYAGRAYHYKMQKERAQQILMSSGFVFMSINEQLAFSKQANMNPVGEAIQDGYLQNWAIVSLPLIPHIVMRICRLISMGQSLERFILIQVVN